METLDAVLSGTSSGGSGVFREAIGEEASKIPPRGVPTLGVISVVDSCFAGSGTGAGVLVDASSCPMSFGFDRIDSEEPRATGETSTSLGWPKAPPFFLSSSAPEEDPAMPRAGSGATSTLSDLAFLG